MKLVKTASGKKIKMSKNDWEDIGKTTGWIKKAQSDPRVVKHINMLITQSGLDRNKLKDFLNLLFSNLQQFSTGQIMEAVKYIGTTPTTENPSVDTGVAQQKTQTIVSGIVL